MGRFSSVSLGLGAWRSMHDAWKKRGGGYASHKGGRWLALYDGIRILYRHTRQATHYSVMELHPPPKRHGWGRLKKAS